MYRWGKLSMYEESSLVRACRCSSPECAALVQGLPFPIGLSIFLLIITSSRNLEI